MNSISLIIEAAIVDCQDDGQGDPSADGQVYDESPFGEETICKRQRSKAGDGEGVLFRLWR